MKRTVGIVVVIAAAFPVTGCLHMENTHRLYLTPRGDLSWTVQQSDVRSDAQQADGRLDEERQFLAEVQRGAHPVALAFHQLGARRVQTELVRPIRPFALLTTGDLGAVDEAANTFLKALNLGGEGALTRHDGKTTLTLTVRVADGDQEYDGPLTALLEDLPQYRVVLTEGRFVAAEGFAISADGAVATPQDWADSLETAVFRVSLTWVE